MNSSRFFLTYFALSLGLGLSLLGADGNQTRPNILFIISDDLATRVSCYGDPVAITPNIDRLAAEGVLFEKAYVQGTVCTPSRTAFMLGLNNRSARRNHFRQHPDTLTMGRYFRQNGYQTFSVGKIDHTEEFADPEAWDIRVPANQANSLLIPLSAIREDLPGAAGRTVSHYGLAEAEEFTRDWAVAERAIRFLKSERQEQQPFFAAIGFHKPHQPVISSKEHFAAYNESRFFQPETPPHASPISPGHLHAEPGMMLSAASQKLAQQAYYASLTTMDAQLGRLLEALDSEGLRDSTLVVFTSDHGYHLGWRGQWAKHDLSEEVMRVPLVARWPKVIPEGGITNGIVELIDLFPTFAEAAGLPIPPTLDGESFLDQLTDPKAPGKQAAFCDDGRRGRTVRTAEWRFIQRLNGAHELYHLPSDPGEYFNQFGKQEHTEVAGELSALLEAELGPLQTRPPR